MTHRCVACGVPVREPESDAVVRGVVTELGSDSADGFYIRLRVTEADAISLALAGAFNRILRITLPKEGA
jgi:hypothetical protein